MVWGFIVSVLILFFVISYFLKVPNTIDGEGILINNDVIDYVSPKEGILKFIQPDNMNIKQNQILWLFETSAQVEEVDSLLVKLHNVKTINFKNFSDLFYDLNIIHTSKLGEIGLPYIEFYIQLKTFIQQQSANPSFLELNMVENKIKTIDQTILQDQDILINIKEKLKVTKGAKQQDSILFDQRLITAEQWQNSKMNFLHAYNEYNEILKSINLQRTSRANLNVEMEKIQKEFGVNEDYLFDKTVEKYVQLIEFIKKWQRENVIKAPFAGTIKYYKFWNKSDFVEKNENLFVFTAREKTREIEVKINIEGAGKIKVGQKCLIELKEYPSKDYGKLQGRVKDIISLKHQEQNKNYSTYIKIQLIEDGLTNYGHFISTSFSMPVYAQIILDNERLFDKIFKRIEKNFKPTY